MHSLPRFIFLIAAVFVLVVPLSDPSRAQTGPSASDIDPATFDIAGVKLGMTPEEAIAALKSFDPAFAVTKKFLSGRGLGFGLVGTEMESLPEADKTSAYFDDLSAVKGAPKTICDKDSLSSSSCRGVHDEDEETIRVWFSRIPGQERVIAVQRDKTFYKLPKPAIPTLMSSILTKYGQAPMTYDRKFGWDHTVGWLFDAKKRPISGTSAKSKALQESGGLPQTVRPGDGIGLNVVFVSNNQNTEIADRFYITFYDATALYNSVEQSKSAYDAVKGRANAKQLDEAVKGAGQTKF